MKTTKKIYAMALALAVTCGLAATVQAQNLIYVANKGNNTIGEYTNSGSALNASLITGLYSPYGIAISGNDLFVANFTSDIIGEYTTSGATVNADLITGLAKPEGVALVPVPEPGAWALLGAGGLLAMILRARRGRV